MTGESYRACAAWLGKTPRRASFFRCLFRLLPLVDAAAYLGTAAFLVITSWPGRWKFLLIPAVTFLLVSLLRRAGMEPDFMMTGGVAKNPGVVRAVEEKIGAPLYICPEPEIVGAAGAALYALERMEGQE